MGNSEAVRLAYNEAAATMDEVVIRNPINAWMRHISRLWLLQTFKPGSCLLELGCGTGEDAIFLGRRGFDVFGIDISDRMIERARAKASAQRLQSRTVFARSSHVGVLNALHVSPWGEFDGAYANFSLAYEESLRTLVEMVHKVLKPKAFFVFTLPNRLVLSEIALYGLRLRFKGLIRRFGRSLTWDVRGHEVKYHAYSPSQVNGTFADFFELKQIVGVPVFLPPTYLHTYYSRMGPARPRLTKLDLLMAAKFPWNRLGEHTLFIFQRL